jgi:23S rRNA (cytosine1962-C5)-methyltransferase
MPDGRWLARGYFNPQSQIVVRILTWHDEAIDADWWRTAIRRAWRARHGLNGTDAVRLIHGESDYLPGVIVDRYEGWLSVQALTLGIDQRKDVIIPALAEVWAEFEPTPLQGIYERSDVDARKKEGLRAQTGPLLGEAPPPVIITEDGTRRYEVDIARGHKTGFYIDQRDNRGLVQGLTALPGGVSAGFSLLNLFSYTGGFGIAARRGGAGEVVPNATRRSTAGRMGRSSSRRMRSSCCAISSTRGGASMRLCATHPSSPTMPGRWRGRRAATKT